MAETTVPTTETEGKASDRLTATDMERAAADIHMIAVLCENAYSRAFHMPAEHQQAVDWSCLENMSHTLERAYDVIVRGMEDGWR